MVSHPTSNPSYRNQNSPTAPPWLLSQDLCLFIYLLETYPDHHHHCRMAYRVKSQEEARPTIYLGVKIKISSGCVRVYEGRACLSWRWSAIHLPYRDIYIRVANAPVCNPECTGIGRRFHYARAPCYSLFRAHAAIRDASLCYSFIFSFWLLRGSFRTPRRAANVF